MLTQEPTPRFLGSVSEAATTPSPDYPCSNPDMLSDEWSEIEDWGMEWYDGRDTIHVRVSATEEDTEWRGVGFYSRGQFSDFNGELNFICLD